MDVKQLLEDTGLVHFYPGKMDRQHLFSVSLYDFDQRSNTKDPKTLCEKYLHEISNFYGECRFLRNRSHFRSTGIRSRKNDHLKEHSLQYQVHPLEISTVILLCCDHVARQDLVRHFWACKHAFPLVLQIPSSNHLGNETQVKMFAWPIRGIVGKVENSEDDTSIEYSLTQMQFKVVSCFRFSDSECSKSGLYNNVINKALPGSSIFYHRECVGSVKDRRQFISGMIESFPYMYTSQGGGPTLYLNLRGNAFDFEMQRNFLIQASSVVIIFCKYSESCQAANLVKKGAILGDQDILFILTDMVDDTNTETNIEKLLQAWPDITFICRKSVQIPDIVEIISEAVLGNKRTSKVENLVRLALENGMNIDENDSEICKHIQDAESVSAVILKRYESHSKHDLFPIQESNYLEWTASDIEICKLRNYTKKETVRNYREKLNKEKIDCRKRQYNLLSADECRNSLIMYLINSTHETMYKYYIRCLQLNLDSIIRPNVNRLHSEYKSFFTEMRLLRKEAKEFEKRICHLDNRMNVKSLSISVFVREMGQIYETVMSQDTVKKGFLYNLCQNLLKAAVFLLCEGYAIEIMDGRSNAVPVEWVQAILKELSQSLGDIRIKVISVLGMQSTGKSTLLNTMFGCQFTVGSGRCTRGVQINLVKVSDNIGHKYSAQYFLLVDTEGILVSTPSSKQATLRDKLGRELATFVIGLANITIINVIGEDVSYLQDILPISVFAFLRMGRVGINPKCKLIHHKVDKKNKRELQTQSHILQERLNDFTEKACSLEGVKIETFNEIINFELNEDVYYFPAFLETKHGKTDVQDAISPLYSLDVMQLKDDIVKDNDANTTVSLTEFSRNLTSMWNAIKKEDFVFEFQTISEADARAKLDIKLCHLNCTKRQELENVISVHRTKMANFATLQDLDVITAEYDKAFNNILETTEDNLLALFDRLQRECRSALIKPLKRVKSACLLECEKNLKESVDEGKYLLNKEKQMRQKELEFIKGDQETKHSVNTFIDSNLPDERNPDRLFEKWTDTVNLRESEIDTYDFEEDMRSSLYKCFWIHKKDVDEVLENFSFRNTPLDKFEIQERFWPKDWRRDLHYERERASDIVKTAYKNCKTLVKQVKKRSIWYSKRLFIDLAYQIRCQRDNLALHIKPRFEIELATSAFCFLARELRTISSTNGLISHGVMRQIRSYFIYRCKTVLGDISDAKSVADKCIDEIIRAMAESALTSTTNLSSPGLSNYFGSYMTKMHPFLMSKQGLLCFIWKNMIETPANNIDNIRRYSTYPSASMKNWLSDLFSIDIIGLNNTDEENLKSVIKMFVDEQIDNIGERLSEIFIEDINNSNVMKTCIDLIIDKLDKSIVISTLRIYENFKIEMEDPNNFMAMLVDKLRSELSRGILVNRIHFTLLEQRQDEIRLQTVESIFKDVIGCEETCPSCGEICCIGQKNHHDDHRALMHRPVGLKNACFSESKSVDTRPCSEECQNNPLFEKWAIPSDVCVEDNSFWKYIFGTYIKDITLKQTFVNTEDIPDSWKGLSKVEQMRELDAIIESVTKL
ncbi:interferon-induced very large GTPase 1-like [Mercenaria mercenaria]|uniref:interferon-induced very large GTPase 1-like n=1 Tax=Mercenaria mercenaria TaxID=6596 RepID=UPI00234ECFFF|nr:interferon-induced very large GTPase 1-like [Mercenaria mercenaria]